jgi:putative transposase
MVLVDQWARKYGVNRTLAALGLSKGSWHHRRRHGQVYTEKYAALKEPLLEIAHEHPHYGYRKVTVELRECYGLRVNGKVVRRLQNAWELPLVRRIHRPRPSAIRRVLRDMGDRINLVATLEAIRPLQVFYTDFTELLFDRRGQKAFLMPLLDHTSKYVVGWAVGPSDNSALAVAAWARARRNLRHLGVDLSQVIVHHDQDSVYTGHEWLRHVRLLDQARVSYALNGAQDNTEMESFNSHFKAENASILWEQRDLAGVIRVVERRMLYYNDIRRHASVGNVSPAQFLRKHGFQPR